VGAESAGGEASELGSVAHAGLAVPVSGGDFGKARLLRSP
jgi:hypothetical protein